MAEHAGSPPECSAGGVIGSVADPAAAGLL
jgi:hypothetical protein